jgi:hypothetical protein
MTLKGDDGKQFLAKFWEMRYRGRSFGIGIDSAKCARLPGYEHSELKKEMDKLVKKVDDEAPGLIV